MERGDQAHLEILRNSAYAKEQRRMPSDVLAFPPGFCWGVATSSHQCEGGITNNQWTAWEQTGHIKTGERAGLACNWWLNAEADFDRAQALGLNALRLSLEWGRIEPLPGTWDAQAITRYRQILRALHERGLAPMVTLHHFTHPIWFEQRGAFLAPDAVTRFAAYAERVVQELGDLCDCWCTINEPNVYATFGYQIGDFPPGRRGDVRATVRVQATMARAHAAAYRAIHRVQPGARVGWAHHYNIFDPARTGHPLDRLVARLQDDAFNEFFPRAVFAGAAPPLVRAWAGDLRGVRDTYDFVGINCYGRDLVRFDLRIPTELFGRRFAHPDVPQGDTGIGHTYGEIYPAGIERIIQRVRGGGKPIYITENGIADRDDRLRPWVIVEAAHAMHAAIASGADVRGYYHWSLVDNFEWVEGWGLRFGLIALDSASQGRAPRRSADLYAALARANALTPEMIAAYVQAPEPVGVQHL
jgi:beta-glucosidase